MPERQNPLPPSAASARPARSLAAAGGLSLILHGAALALLAGLVGTAPPEPVAVFTVELVAPPATTAKPAGVESSPDSNTDEARAAASPSSQSSSRPSSERGQAPVRSPVERKEASADAPMPPVLPAPVLPSPPPPLPPAARPIPEVAAATPPPAAVKSEIAAAKPAPAPSPPAPAVVRPRPAPAAPEKIIAPAPPKKFIAAIPTDTAAARVHRPPVLPRPKPPAPPRSAAARTPTPRATPSLEATIARMKGREPWRRKEASLTTDLEPTTAEPTARPGDRPPRPPAPSPSDSRPPPAPPPDTTSGAKPDAEPGAPGGALASIEGSAPRFVGPGLANPLPRYPYAARRRGQEGRVVLRVRVSAQGTADSVAVKQSSGYRLLDAAAVEAVARWRFVPARRWGRPQPGVVDVPVTFRLEN